MVVFGLLLFVLGMWVDAFYVRHGSNAAVRAQIHLLQVAEHEAAVLGARVDFHLVEAGNGYAADLGSPALLSEPVTGRFRTAPDSARSVRFAWSGDTVFGHADNDRLQSPLWEDLFHGLERLVADRSALHGPLPGRARLVPCRAIAPACGMVEACANVRPGGLWANTDSGATACSAKPPLSARLSDSVPPEVNTTSPGRALSACAIFSRDSSTTRRAARPEACSDEGLPIRVICSVIAATALAYIGVDAAWSR